MELHREGSAPTACSGLLYIYVARIDGTEEVLAHPAGCREAVERDDVAERSDVGVADQGQGTLGDDMVITMTMMLEDVLTIQERLGDVQSGMLSSGGQGSHEVTG